MFGNTTIPVLEQVAAFTQARHHVLAGNVANMDTPGYRVRDLSVDTFQERLRAAIEAREYVRSLGLFGRAAARTGRRDAARSGFDAGNPFS